MGITTRHDFPNYLEYDSVKQLIVPHHIVEGERPKSQATGFQPRLKRNNRLVGNSCV